MDMQHPPRTRAGLWLVTDRVKGRVIVDPSTVCDAGRPIVPQHRPAECAGWQGRVLAPGKYLLIGSCRDGNKTHRARRTFSGDLQQQFVIADVYTTDGPLGWMDNLSDQITYRYLGDCPKGMVGKESF
jgi:hypothetical protein